MLCNDNDDSPFNELMFFNCIISAVFSFIALSLFCFYNKNQTFMSIIICNIIIIAFIQTCSYFFEKFNDRIVKSLSMFCNISISLSLASLYILTTHYITLNICNKKGTYIQIMLFCILIDFIPFISSFSLCKFVFDLSETKKDNLYYYLVNFCFTLLILLVNIILIIRMFLSVTKETTVKTKKYPLRVLLFFITYILCSINMLICEGLIISSNEPYEVYRKISELLFEVQGIIYPICYIFYPSVFGIVKSFFSDNYTPKKVSTNTIHISSGVGGESKNDSLVQSLTQTIYD